MVVEEKEEEELELTMQTLLPLSRILDIFVCWPL